MSNSAFVASIDSPKSEFTPVFDALAQPEFVAPEVCQTYSLTDWSLLLESLTNQQRLVIWQCIPKNKRGSILAQMREDSRGQLLKQLSAQKIQQTLNSASSSEVVDILEVLPTKTANKFIKKLSPEQQLTLNNAMHYDEKEIGRYSNSDVFTVAINEDIQNVLAEITEQGLPEYTDALVVVNADNIYQGIILLEQLLASDSEAKVESLLLKEPPILATTSLLDASNIIKNSQRGMLPIVSNQGELIGRISLYDALAIFQQHYEAQISHLGKVSDEDLFAPTLLSARRRAIWLGINLLTAFIASFVISAFDKVIAEVVALAVLMPIVASMGGITGSQTLTLTIRGLATGQLSTGNLGVLRKKEIQVSLINGFIWAILVAALTGYWFDNYTLSLIIAVALVINMLAAAYAGILIPVTLQKLNIDPALAGSVILTTVTDVVGFFVFLGSATLLFL